MDRQPPFAINSQLHFYGGRRRGKEGKGGGGKGERREGRGEMRKKGEKRGKVQDKIRYGICKKIRGAAPPDPPLSLRPRCDSHLNVPLGHFSVASKMYPAGPLRKGGRAELGLGSLGGTEVPTSGWAFGGIKNGAFWR